MTERVMTKHPQGKNGVNIERAKYEQIKSAITKALLSEGDLSYSALNRAVEKQLKGKFDGKIPWYVETVKLDLEARGVVARVPKTSPQLLRLKKQA